MTWPLARSVKVVIHGSIRCQAPASSRYQRTVRNRCSSIPSHDTSRGRAASRVAAAVASCRITVGQDAPYYAATASTQRTSPAQAATIRCLSRVVIRANGGTCSVDWVNVARGHAASPHRHRFLTHQTFTSPSKPTSRTRCLLR